MHETGCLICKAPLVYLDEGVTMRCAICRDKMISRAKCENGHFVCDKCHTQGLDSIVALCLAEETDDPVEIMEHLMSQPFCHMHGPEHHTMVGAALLTAYHNAGGEIDLTRALPEMLRRGKEVPGGVCGYWGACGAALSTGIFMAIVSNSSPLATEPFRLSNLMTAKALTAVGETGGPRCCKRDSYLSILAAVDYVAEHLGVQMKKRDITCTRMAMNEQCIGKRCPFSPAAKQAT